MGVCSELYFDEKGRIVKNMCHLYVLCVCVNVCICVHEHLSMLKRTGVRSRQTLRLNSFKAYLMDVNGQSATAHTHKNTCRTGSKTHSIEH